MKYEVTHKINGEHRPLGTTDNYDTAKSLIGEALTKALGGNGHLDDETSLDLYEATKGVVDMDPGDFLEIPIRGYQFAVRLTEAPAFDRDEIAAAIETITEAVDAMRAAADAARTLGAYGEAYSVDPLTTIYNNYRTAAVHCDAFNCLERDAHEAASYYPTSGS
jgi:hypothetical protein